MRLSNDPTKEQIHKEAKTSNNFTRSHYLRHYNNKIILARTVSCDFCFILTSMSFPYKRTTRRCEQKESQKFNSLEISKTLCEINGRSHWSQRITEL